jgi:hypothetical protein
VERFRRTDDHGIFLPNPRLSDEMQPCEKRIGIGSISGTSCGSKFLVKSLQRTSRKHRIPKSKHDPMLLTMVIRLDSDDGSKVSPCPFEAAGARADNCTRRDDRNLRHRTETSDASLISEPSAWITSQSTNYPRVMRDSSGNNLTIVAPFLCLVSQTLGSEELFSGACACNRLVYLSSIALDGQYGNVADQVRALALPIVESVESAVKLRPDIVFIASYSSAEDFSRDTLAGVLKK